MAKTREKGETPFEMGWVKKVPCEKRGCERFLEKLREAELEMEREEEEDVRESFLIWDGRVSHEHETDAAIFFSLCK